jgi:hypothetical protein
MRDYMQETKVLADRSIEFSRRAIKAAKLGTMAGEEVLALAEWQASAEAVRYAPRRIECGQYEVLDLKTGARASGTLAASYGATWERCRELNGRVA